jgi:prepilin-type processing-associated H-X9-DG protein
MLPDGACAHYGTDGGCLARGSGHAHLDGSGERELANEGVFPAWAPDGRLGWTGPGGFNVAFVDGGCRQVIDEVDQYLSWMS